MITVVAALIEREGRLLVCQRRCNDTFALRWEFPGGKTRPDETPAEALARELAEELGVTATIGGEVFRTRHRYAELSDDLELLFYAATLGEQPLRNLAFERIEWLEPAVLPQYDFLPADRELIRLLATGALRLL